MKIALLLLVKVAALSVAFRATLAVERTVEQANEHKNADAELSFDEQVIMRKMLTGTATSEESRLITDKLTRKMKARRAQKMAKSVKNGDGVYSRRELQKMMKRVEQGLATPEENKIVEESKEKEQNKLLQKIKQAKSRRRGGGERSREESPRKSKKNKKGAIKIESLLDLQSETKGDQSSDLKKNERAKDELKLSHKSKKSKNKKSKNKNQKSKNLINVEKNKRKITSKQNSKEIKAEDDVASHVTRQPKSSQAQKATMGNLEENHGSTISVQSKRKNKNLSTKMRPKIQRNEQMQVDAAAASTENVKVTKKPTSIEMNKNKITEKEEKVTRIKNKTKQKEKTRATKQPKSNKKNSHTGKQEKIELKQNQRENDGNSAIDNTIIETKTGEKSKKQSHLQQSTTSTDTTSKKPDGKLQVDHGKPKPKSKSDLSSGATIKNRNQSDSTKNTLQVHKLTNDDFVNSFDDKIRQLSIQSKLRGEKEEILIPNNPTNPEKQADKTNQKDNKSRVINTNPNSQKESNTKANEKKPNSEMSQKVKKPTNTIELPSNQEIANVINNAEEQTQLELYDVAEKLKEFNKLQSNKDN